MIQDHVPRIKISRETYLQVHVPMIKGSRVIYLRGKGTGPRTYGARIRGEARRPPAPGGDGTGGATGDFTLTLQCRSTQSTAPVAQGTGKRP